MDFQYKIDTFQSKQPNKTGEKTHFSENNDISRAYCPTGTMVPPPLLVSF